MFHLLDDTLTAILADAGAPSQVRGAAVQFVTPHSQFTPNNSTIDLFLYEVKENRELRDPVPITKIQGTTFVRQRPPLRVDCNYVVTTWLSKDPATPVDTRLEHELLALTLLWLSRFPTIPPTFLQGSLADQPYPPPTMVAQLDASKNSVGEFWSALGIAPRPYFNLTVTIAMDLGVQALDGPPVVTKDTRLQQIEPIGAFETAFTIGGTVRNSVTTAAIENALVTLIELNRSAATDKEGQFQIDNLPAGNFTLRTTAAGFTQRDDAIVVPGVQLNAFDVSLTP